MPTPLKSNMKFSKNKLSPTEKPKSKYTASSTPTNWPSSLPYLSTPRHSRSLTSAHLVSLRRNPSNTNIATGLPRIPLLSTSTSTSSLTSSFVLPRDVPRAPCAAVKITPISDGKHPANGQAGLFAARDLKPGEFLLEYIGVVHGDGDAASASSDYDLSLDRLTGLAVDAATMGNEARFINDYRGVGDKPNAEFREIWSTARGERGMGVFVLGEGKKKLFKGIKKGEEVLVSYGRGFWGARRDGVDEKDDQYGDTNISPSLSKGDLLPLQAESSAA